jgi:hypothetical protein
VELLRHSDANAGRVVPPAIVNFAGNLQAGGSGFKPQFDSLGTYQPTVGNVVMFACPNDLSDTGGIFGSAAISAGWHRLVSTDPTYSGTVFFNVIWKVWTGLDSTTTVIDPVFRNCYIAYEVSGEDPALPVNGCGYTGGGGQTVTVTLNSPAQPTVNNSLGIYLVWSQGRSNASLPTPTYSNGFGANGGAVLDSLSGVGGTINGGSLAGLSTGAFLFVVGSPFPGADAHQGAMPIFSPPAGPPPFATSRRRDFYFPLRAAVGRT